MGSSNWLNNNHLHREWRQLLQEPVQIVADIFTDRWCDQWCKPPRAERHLRRSLCWRPRALLSTKQEDVLRLSAFSCGNNFHTFCDKPYHSWFIRVYWFRRHNNFQICKRIFKQVADACGCNFSTRKNRYTNVSKRLTEPHETLYNLFGCAQRRVRDDCVTLRCISKEVVVVARTVSTIACTRYT